MVAEGVRLCLSTTGAVVAPCRALVNSCPNGREAFEPSLILLIRTQPVVAQGQLMTLTARERVRSATSRKRGSRNQNPTLATMEAGLSDKSQTETVHAKTGGTK